MKKLSILLAVIFFALQPALADTLNYRIKQDGSAMVIVPYYSQPSLQKPSSIIETAPAKIPYYSNKNLPKGKNRTRSV